LKERISLLHLIGIIYFTVSGGAFGLEELIRSAGPGLALLLLIVTPLLWSLPIALMAAEMGSMLPLEGGYYRWVHFALGRFWGFQEGWWTWLYTFVDMALYPVLFAEYARYFFPGLTGWQHWLVTLLVIYSSLVLNLRGPRSVGRSAVLSFIIVTLPFLLFSALGMLKMQNVPWQPFTPGDHSLGQSIGLGLSVVLWSYSGWDNVSTFAGEVERPKRNYPLAMMVSVPLVTLLYLLPIGVGLGATHSWQEWQTGTFPQVAVQVGGPWLGAMMSLGVLFSVWSLFNSQLLYTSRLPWAMAEDGLLPRMLSRRHPRWGTPHVSLLLCSVIYSLFALLDFRKLVAMDVLLYSIALMLEFVALIKLRWHRPDLERPFKIPGGWLGLTLMTCALAAFALACLTFTLVGREESWKQVAIVAAMLLTGPLAFFVGKKVRRSSTERDGLPEWRSPK
jgi:amino acid transporter